MYLGGSSTVSRACLIFKQSTLEKLWPIVFQSSHKVVNFGKIISPQISIQHMKDCAETALNPFQKSENKQETKITCIIYNVGMATQNLLKLMLMIRNSLLQ